MKAVVVIGCLALSVFAQNRPLLTEDFESGQLDSKLWEQRVQGAATLQVQQKEAAHGKYALQVNYPDMATQSFGLLVAPHLPEALRGHVFGRAYVKIVPGLPQSHTVLLLAGGSSDGGTRRCGVAARCN